MAKVYFDFETAQNLSLLSSVLFLWINLDWDSVKFRIGKFSMEN